MAILKFDTPEERAIKALTKRGIKEERAKELIDGFDGYEKEIIADTFRPETRVRFSAYDPFPNPELADIREFIKESIKERSKDEHYGTGLSSARADRELLAKIERQLELPSINDHKWSITIESECGDARASLICDTPCDEPQCYCHTSVLEWAELMAHFPVTLKITGGGYNSFHGDYDECVAEAEIDHERL